MSLMEDRAQNIVWSVEMCMRTAALVLLPLALPLTGCKNRCERAVEHVLDVAAGEDSPDKQRVRETAGADFVKYGEETTREFRRRMLLRQLGPQCRDRAFTDCLLDAKDTAAIRVCFDGVSARP
jgi:hypothetical protein